MNARTHQDYASTDDRVPDAVIDGDMVIIPRRTFERLMSEIERLRARTVTIAVRKETP